MMTIKLIDFAYCILFESVLLYRYIQGINTMTKTDLNNISTTRELIKAVEKIGYTEKPKNGSSHRIFGKSGMPTLSIPDKKILAPGTKRNIVKLVLGNDYYLKG
jgi:predicted RNA binding protein YcfA (HicA-like mRNA interferase family)